MSALQIIIDRRKKNFVPLHF